MASRKVSPVRSPSSTSEEQVAQETEEVFRSYAFYRHQQEQEAEREAAPADSEMDILPEELSSTIKEVGRRLAIIGHKYDKEFEEMLQDLKPTAENAYECFTKIASSLFESGISWGRVVALLEFGYRIARYVYRKVHQCLIGFLGRVARFVADFIGKKCITQWIAQNGGWVAVLGFTVLAGVCIGLLASQGLNCN